MATVRYTVINSEVIAEKRSGVRRQYVPDPLGSTVALLDNTQAKTDTFTYWPYGEEATRTGTTATSFRYVGTLGYYRDSATKSYVRARYLDTKLGRWVSEDPVYLGDSNAPDYNAYCYVSNRPTVLVDYSGLEAVGRDPCARICLACRLCFIPFICIPVCIACLSCLRRENDRPKPCDDPSCESLEDRDFLDKDAGSSLNRCKKRGESCGKAKKDDADTCPGGKHYTYRCDSGVITVLCCPCKTANGGTSQRCRCKLH